MNVVEPKLLPTVYGRANYLKREVMALARFGAPRKEEKKETLAQFMADALAFVNDRLGTSAAAELPSTSAIVTDGQVLPVTGGTVTLDVTAGVVTATYVAA